MNPQLLNNPATLEKLLQIICDWSNRDIKLVLSKSRKRELVITRQLYHYFARKYTQESLTTIGKLTGSQDHTTVIHSCNTINDLMETDSDFNAFVKNLEEAVVRVATDAASRTKRLEVIGKVVRIQKFIRRVQESQYGQKFI